jgi:hypothetical protein
MDALDGMPNLGKRVMAQVSVEDPARTGDDRENEQRSKPMKNVSRSSAALV